MEKKYPVEPKGVATTMPSPMSPGRYAFPSIQSLNLSAAWEVRFLTTTSFAAYFLMTRFPALTLTSASDTHEDDSPWS